MMGATAINTPMRTLIVLLALVAGILFCAIYVVASGPGRSEAEAALADAKSRADEAGKDAAERIGPLEQENADLREQLEVAKANLERGAEKLAAVEREASHLRNEIDAASKQVVELSQEYGARIKKAEDSLAATVKQNAATVVKPPAPENKLLQLGNQKPSPTKGKNDDAAAPARRGAVASLPRTSPSFSDLDTDHDGRLSLAEYKVGFPNTPNVEAEFKALDTNGDGFLSIDEYKAGHPDPPVVPAPTKRGKKN
jgi:hypothetical protein